MGLSFGQLSVPQLPELGWLASGSVFGGGGGREPGGGGGGRPLGAPPFMAVPPTPRELSRLTFCVEPSGLVIWFIATTRAVMAEGGSLPAPEGMRAPSGRDG